MTAALGSRSDAKVLVSLAVVWCVLCALTHPLGDFPLNDDWVYALAVKAILRTGGFALPSPASANVIAQAYWGALFCLPFGFSFTALRISTIVLGAVGVMSLHLLLREMGANRTTAAIGALTMAVNPLYLDLATSFMTDVPYLAVSTASLWLYVRGVRRGAAWSTVGAYALAVVAILVRQFALALPLAFAVAHITRNGARWRVVVAAVLPFAGAMLLQVAFGRWLIASGRTPDLHIAEVRPRLADIVPLLFGALRFSLIVLPYLGLYLAPFAVHLVSIVVRARDRTADHGWLSRAMIRRWALGWVLLVAALLASGYVLPTLGNVLIPSGLGPLTLRDTYLLHQNMPELSRAVVAMWLVATEFSAIVAVFVLLGAGTTVADFARRLPCAERRAEAWPVALMLTIVGVYAAGLVLLGPSHGIFDRYLLVFVAPVMALMLMPAAEHEWRSAVVWRRLPAAIALVACAAFSVAATHDYLAWNRARWQATDFLAARGVTPDRIDGGYEFNGWYLYRPTYTPQPGKSYWWVEDDSYVIASGPLAGYAAIQRFEYPRWLGLSHASVLVLRREAVPGP